MTRKRVVITGATGFIGRNLVASLAPEFDVHALVRTHSPRKEHLTEQGFTIDEFESADDMRESLHNINPDVTMHLATQFPTRGHSRDPGLLIEANVSFAAEVARAATDVGSKFVNTSSYWQHYEGARYAPVSLYAATKEAFRPILQYFADVEGLRVVDVCLFDSYGPNDDRGKLTDILMNAALHGTTLQMSQGTQLINILSVSDVVAGLRLAIEAPVGDYEIRSDDWISVRDFAEIVSEVVGMPLGVEWGALEDRPREMRFPWTVSPLVPGWRQRTSLRDGLSELWQMKSQASS